MDTQYTANRRNAATQAAVDRFAANPAAKRTRSLELASKNGLTRDARAVVIDRDSVGVVRTVVSVVPSLSQPDSQHIVIYDAATDSADCDCAAGANGLACGHAGAGLLAGRAAARFILVYFGPAEATLVGHTGDIVRL